MIPHRMSKSAVDMVSKVIEDYIPRLPSITECDELQAKVKSMYESGYINYARYSRWITGINNARKLIEKGE